jgi:hypothetical protein
MRGGGGCGEVRVFGYGYGDWHWDYCFMEGAAGQGEREVPDMWAGRPLLC